MRETEPTPTTAVKTAGNTPPKQWDPFVRRHPDATFFHLAAWKGVLERVYGLKTYYLYAQDGDTIRGVLPLARVRRPLFGSALVSTPFCVYGGAVADNPAAGTALEDAATRLAVEFGVDYLECRNTRLRDTADAQSARFATFRKALPTDADGVLSTIPRKERADVRKGIAAGLRADFDDDPDLFYDLYAASVRDLGTPVYPRRYIRALCDTFGADCEILTVRQDGQPICGVLSFYFRDQVLPYYAGALPAARASRGYHFMYWELMRHACDRGTRVFDFGRSPVGSGAFAFKRNWGFEPTPLPYTYRMARGHAVPDVTPTNPKYRLLIETWKRLPLPVANRIGPLFAPMLA